jgi:hypothetical protein
LKNGDEITHSVALEEVQSDLDARLQLNVRRQAGLFSIEYAPRSESVTGWLWQALPNAESMQCAL